MPLIGIRHACRAVGRSRATHYRSLVPALVVAAGQVTEVAVRAPQVQPRALNIAERDAVSESNCKTLKYRPDFPKNFTSLEHAKAHCADFFRWYNTDHRHLGIGMHTPSNVHHGRAAAIQLSRAAVLTTAYGANPERFVRHPPKPPSFPTTSWINEPKDEEEIPNSLKV